MQKRIGFAAAADCRFVSTRLSRHWEVSHFNCDAPCSPVSPRWINLENPWGYLPSVSDTPSKTTPWGDAGLTWSRLNRGACGSTPEIHGSYAVLHDIFLACMMLEPNIDPWLLHILQNNLDFGRGAHSKVVHSPRGHVIPPLLGFLVSCRLAINFFRHHAPHGPS